MGRVFESRRVRHMKSTKSRFRSGLFPSSGALTEKYLCKECTGKTYYLDATHLGTRLTEELTGQSCLVNRHKRTKNILSSFAKKLGVVGKLK